MTAAERRFEDDIRWLLKSDEAELAGDLDRVESALDDLSNATRFGIEHYRFSAIQKMKSLIVYLRVANDIE